MSDSSSGRRSVLGFSSKWTIRPCRLTFRMPKPDACSAVTGGRHRGVGHVLPVGLLHLAEVQLVELVPGEDQHLAAAVAAQVAHALPDGVGRAWNHSGLSSVCSAASVETKPELKMSNL